MSTILTEDLLDQYRRSISMLRVTIARFSAEQWTSGISRLQSPAADPALHLLRQRGR
jgi:hypothetical protein